VKIIKGVNARMFNADKLEFHFVRTANPRI